MPESIVKEVFYTRVFERNRDSKALVVVNVGGARSSKSYSICQLLISKLLIEKNKAIGICRKTFPALRMSTMKDFFSLLKEYGIYKESNHNKTFNTYTHLTNTVQFFGLDETGKVRSTGFNYLYLEESNDFTYEDYMVMKLRLSNPCEPGERNQMYLCLNPTDANNWIANKAIKESDVEVIHSTFNDNPFLSPEYRKSLTDTIYQDENYYRIYALGEWGRLDGRIYNNYKVIPELPDFKDTTAHWAYGLDFGLINPTAIVKVWLLDGKIYAEERLYKEGLTNKDIIEFFSHETRGDIYGDPSAKMMIEEIRRAGYSIYEGHKGVKESIDLCQRQTLLIPSSSVFLVKEIQGYTWRKDPQDKERFMLEPVKHNDHACVAGESLVYTTNGEIPIKDLLNKNGYLYTYDEVKKQITVGEFSNVRQTGIKQTIKLELNNGSFVVLTGDHPVMLRSGDWIEAKELKPGDSLMPCYQSIDSHGHLRICLNNGESEFAHKLVWNKFNTPIQDSWTFNVHHKDEDKLNNNPDNLQLLTRAEHCGLHAKLRRNPSAETRIKLRESAKRRLLEPEYKTKMLEHLDNIRELAKIWHQSPEGIAWHKEHGSKYLVVKKYPRTCPVCGTNFISGQSFGKYCHPNCKAKALRKRRKECYNHKVISVTPGEIIPVYNLEVTDTHNFVCNGIILHNCDAMRYAIWGITERFGMATQRPGVTEPLQTLSFPNRGQEDNPIINRWIKGR